MAVPYSYPNTKHGRRLSPPPYTNYRQFKPHLREEFAGQCVYCRALDKLKGHEAFGVDHYRPKDKFDALKNQYSNLFYACNRCNGWKRNFWPSPTQLKAKLFVPNPCDHRMTEHLRYQHAEVASESRAGEWAIHLLDLNNPDVVENRAWVIGAFQMYAEQLATVKATIAEAEKQLKRAKTDADRKRLAAALEKAKQNRQELDAKLAIYP
jgi:hypothetical protein